MRRLSRHVLMGLGIGVSLLIIVLLMLTNGVWAGLGNASPTPFQLTLAGTGFTYQGELTQSGRPANGTFDFRFRLFDAASGGQQVGKTVTKDDVQVTNGHFTLVLDFGPNVFNGEARWLELAVRPGNSTGSYTVLSPRQALHPVPYALALPGLRIERVPDSDVPNIIGGHISNTVTSGVDGAVIAGGGAVIVGGTSWINQVTGTFGTVSGGADNIAGAWSVAGGGLSNWATGNTSTIGGGEMNAAGGKYATVGGGRTNSAGGEYATVAGGGGPFYQHKGNEAHGDWSAVGGGNDNHAMATASTIPGGSQAWARDYGQFAYASGAFSESIYLGATGTAQFSLYVLRYEVPAEDDIAYTLKLDGYSKHISVPISHTIAFDILVTARSQEGESAAWNIQGVIENTGGTTQLVGQPIVTTLSNDPNWDTYVQADDTTDSLLIWIYSYSETPVRWVAVVRAAQVGWELPPN